MVETVTWVLLAAAGFFTMRLIPKVAAPVEPWLERIGALLFAGAGIIGATGWIGDAIGWLVNVVPDVADNLGNRAFGTGIVWIVIAGVGIAWVFAFLPRSVIAYDYPDWLVISGFFLPMMISAVPGKLGEGLGAVIEFGGQAAVNAVSGLVA